MCDQRCALSAGCLAAAQFGICAVGRGEKDGAGSAKRYNRAWERREGHVVHWIEGAGHNSCCDRPDTVNSLIEEFIRRVKG